jgi:hypothetical protein
MMPLSQNAINALTRAAENPVILLSDHWSADGTAIAELLAVGYVQPEDTSGKWYEVSDSGYDYAESIGANVCRFNRQAVMWTR